MEVFESRLYGRLWAPQRLGEYAALVDGLATAGRPLSGWRGQSNAEWPLHSSAYRRLKTQPRGWLLDDPYSAENALREYENRLLQQARLAGHGFRERRLDDLELLGLLQHHGAATRLMDFTENAFVALWFACRTGLDRFGVVVGVALDDALRISREDHLERTFAELLNDAEGRLTMWKPAPLSPRMPAQSAFLLWSEVQGKDWSSLGTMASNEPDEKEISELSSEFSAIAVSPELKGEMKGRWRELLGYTEQSMFPDFDGFANTHAVTQELAWDFFLD